MTQDKHQHLIHEKDTNLRDYKLRKFLKILVIVFAIHMIWSFTGSIFFSYILRTEITELTYVNRYIEGTGLLGFKEKVVTSHDGGRLTWLKAEGEKVSVGTRVAKITGADGREEILTSPAPGIFSATIDGLEGIVYPHLDWVPEKEVFNTLEPAPRDFKTDDMVPAGSPIFKVISNFTWYYTAVLSEAEMALLEGRQLSLEFAFYDGLFSVESLKRHDLGEGYSFVVFSLSRDAGDFYRRRREDARVIYDRETGVSLPSSAIISKNGQKGIYRYVRSAISFVEVEVLAEVEGTKRVVVTGLEPGWMIVTNPRFFREGQRLF